MQNSCSSSVALIDHFDLRQVFLPLQGKQYIDGPFTAPLYHEVAHRADPGPHLGADGENDDG
jgi:hypothetical protein